MTTCEFIFAILVSPSPKVVAAVNSIITGTLGGILFNFV